MKKLTDSLAVTRDKFKKDIAEIYARYDADLAQAKADYNPKSGKLADVIEELKQTRDIALDKAKSEARNYIYQIATELTEKETAKVIKFDSITFKMIDTIKNIPMTPLEFKVLVEAYGAKDYMCDRLLQQIAERNNISDATIRLEPSLDEKVAIIDGLMEQFDKLVDEYKGQSVYELEILLTDKRLFSALEQYSTTFSDADLTDVELARKASTVVLSKTNLLDQALAITNALKSAPNDTTRNAIIADLLKHNISTDACRLARCEKVFDDFRKTGAVEQFDEALEMRNEINAKVERATKDERTSGAFRRSIAETISDHKDNPYAMQMVSDMTKTSQLVADASAVVNEAYKGTIKIQSAPMGE